MKRHDSQLMSQRIKRYANTSFLELQEINRSPIHGYEDISLQSLEETTERIIAFVPGLMDNVAKAKLNCNRDSTILTLDESAAIYLYTMPIPLYSTSNKALRAENREELKPWENTIISIQTLHGKNILPLSAFPIECEVVLPPGTCLRVQSDTLIIDDQYFIIQLEEMVQLS
ncbi:unnamed protein product [Rotaria magnacalcarata]|uniref:Uncharacterized protein n=1 Tax=Rotaria magnacalcarata TaxID=392030 RepID=A0A816KEG5_9BILA|nr:unnamed protein product [Rotaria magnacalcarata]